KQLHFAIPVEKPSYKNVVTIREMSFRYDQRWIFQEVNLDIYRGERLALVGLNGSGKTTLTRLLSGQLSAQKGVVKLGRNVVLGYYAQHQIDQLNLENTVYNEVLSAAAANSVEKIRDVLGIFNFSGDDILKKIKVLSGGEKARVSLVKILLSPVNFLIMDEPTNHLDLSSRQALENALAEYGGTLLLISHDRYFLDKLVHRVFELKEGRLQSYEGNYSDYLQKREERRVEYISEIRGKTAPSSREKIKEKKRREAEARQAISRERKTLEQEIRTIENRLNKLEQQKTDLENQMADPASYGNSEKAARMQIAYTATTQELEQLYLSWETVQMQLEELMSRLQKND
ncbi:MAG TPA: ATP-binding cassette domain-containing protein, partial [Caldithrix sp.]|nr:ATP-binding cassette domain-containing protein [Caldithrix sp.]